MKFMKKLTVLSVACLMGIGLAGCGSNGGGTIAVYSRDASSGTREAFEKANDMVNQLTDSAITVDSNGDMATKVGQDANGIGYVSLSTDFEANNLKALNYEGVEPTEATVLDGTYGMQRPFSHFETARSVTPSSSASSFCVIFNSFLLLAINSPIIF